MNQATHRSPVVIATWRFGKKAVETAGTLLAQGHSILDAVEKGINVVELAPSESSVGYGGTPNRDGIVELDAAIMDGETHSSGAVAGLQHVKRAISVARRVMTETPHAMLVGDGALQFAIQQGFEQTDLLTEQSRTRWQEWRAKQNSSESHDTIGLAALDASGQLAVGCSTSGSGFKLPGRVGDSPIVGSGLYLDRKFGVASATGLGEEILRFCASFLVVERMGQGDSPTVACEYALRRILSRKPDDARIQIGLIALSPEGEVGGAALRPGFQYAVWRDGKAELFNTIPVTLDD